MGPAVRPPKPPKKTIACAVRGSKVCFSRANASNRIALKGTRLAKATCGTIRLKLFKIGARIKVSVRRFLVHLASACPYQDVFCQALNNLRAYPLRT